ncbi:MAG: RNA-binding protein [Bacteroidetes bacterium]|nr:MAG: RNA-binding protein [Bacteroidota bacterium]
MKNSYLPGLLLLLIACQPGQQEKSAAPPLFTLLSPEQTGVHFANTLTDTKTFNLINYLYYYNGGGVAAGDINNDGLTDLYFTSNLEPSRLYLNKGNFQFEDITEKAGVGGRQGWTTGVCMVDINGDGFLDIYLSHLGEYLDKSGRNELFINRGDGTFSEEAAAYGLDLKGFSTQSTFLDYDLDGDIDLFYLTHSVNPASTIGPVDQRLTRDPLAGDRLMRNDGGKFTEVSEAAGIFGSKLGYGLGVMAGDINMDGWPDIYVGNDFHEDDYLYINQKNGTFAESLRMHMGHTSRFSMGVDMADINNDCLPDLMSLDMKPAREDILKSAEAPESYEIFQYKLSYGYYHQYPHNALQLNRGDGTFSEISQLTGVDATDWSWSPLLCDLDLDGFKDIYISNGIYRRQNDMDYIKFIQQPELTRALNQGPSEKDFEIIERMPSVKVASFTYRNEGGYLFSDQSQAWGLGQPAFSNGSAYADLDNDGDQDLIVNNINEPAFIYRNESREQNKANYLKINLKGDAGNVQGIGAKVWVWANGQVQYQEHQPVRGFQSAVAPGFVFGLGTSVKADSLRIVWPGAKCQIIRDLPANQSLLLEQSQAKETFVYPPSVKTPRFAPEPLPAGLDFIHQENAFNDFNREELLPHLLSTEGPRMALSDVNVDGRDDVYICGASGQSGQLYLQQANGAFQASQPELWTEFAFQEETNSLFFDANGDQMPDLYIVCGGNEFPEGDSRYQDRLYLNEGQGRFALAKDHLPSMTGNGSALAAGDPDGDGDLDLFVGNRSIPGSYGLSPRAFLLINDGKGHFEDQTEARCPQLLQAGMVTDAVWADIDADKDADLLLCGEWMPLTVLRNEQGRLTPATDQLGLGRSQGWWNRLHVADLDGDGDMDVVAGNLGLNSTLKSADNEPCTLFVKDFDGNGSSDPVLCYYKEGVSYPMASRDELLRQILPLRRKYPRYTDYATATVKDIFTPEQLEESLVKSAYTFASTLFVNEGGHFRMQPLPTEAQFSPVYSILSGDFDADGHMDILLGGNFYGVPPNQGRYDAQAAILLRGDGSMHFQLEITAFRPAGQIRDMRVLQNGKRRLLLLARNNASLQAFSLP